MYVPGRLLRRPSPNSEFGTCVPGRLPSRPRTLTRRLPLFAKDTFRHALSAACTRHAGLGPASLVLFDVSALYFETDAGDGFREPGFSKERVRREALVDRMEVRDLHGGSVAAGLRS
jgi:hypothetical protein